MIDVKLARDFLECIVCACGYGLWLVQGLGRAAGDRLCVREQPWQLAEIDLTIVLGSSEAIDVVQAFCDVLMCRSMLQPTIEHRDARRTELVLVTGEVVNPFRTSSIFPSAHAR